MRRAGEADATALHGAPARRRGFTLVEMVVVVLVVAFLAALAQPRLHRALTKARAAAAIQDLHVVRVAVLNYYAKNNVYPPDANGGQVPTGLAPFLPANFSFTRDTYAIDYENWSSYAPGLVGLSIRTDDRTLGLEVMNLLGNNTWTNGTTDFIWVMEWTR